MRNLSLNALPCDRHPDAVCSISDKNAAERRFLAALRGGLLRVFRREKQIRFPLQNLSDVVRLIFQFQIVIAELFHFKAVLFVFFIVERFQFVDRKLVEFI